MKKYVCPCGYVYDPEVGDPENGIKPGIVTPMPFNPEKSTTPNAIARRYPTIKPNKTDSCLKYFLAKS